MSRRARGLRVMASVLAVGVLLSGAAAGADRDEPVLVFAAASLTDVLNDLSREWEKSSGRRVRTSFAASSMLARQIEAGSAAQVFISADRQWMDYLDARDLVDKASRRELAGNRLVLIAPADSRTALVVAPGFELAAALGGGRLSTGDPEIVPAGRYARSALQTLGVWDAVEHSLVRAESVRAALTYVARGEAALGIVYATDAAMDPRVRVVATFPPATHPPITYPAALTVGAGREAAAYLAFLGSAEAMAAWKRFGFLEVSR